MKLLEDKILAEGIAESENILKVDSFINHQVDPELMKKMGKDIAEHYKGKGITHVLLPSKAPVLLRLLWLQKH